MSDKLQRFPDRWIHGAPDCAASSDPPFQVHRYDARTYILRQSKCVAFEAPFLFVLVGDDRALLVDTGGEPDAGGDIPIRPVVDGILTAHDPSLERVVGHSHSHGDHVFGDRYFRDRPHTRIVGHSVEEVAAEYGIEGWPEGAGSFDLGGRLLTVIPAPGHEPASVCFYDPATRILLSGDVLYPGKLTVRDRRAYRETARRLARFAAEHPVEWVLGCHVEMKRTPGRALRDRHPLPAGGARPPAVSRRPAGVGRDVRGAGRRAGPDHARQLRDLARGRGVVTVSEDAPAAAAGHRGVVRR
jgi:glyoxylase-like metal-dependent hydrolase (beta-lactamase superfamily II)